MNKDNLPTFQRWGVKILERKRAIAIVLLILCVKHFGTNYRKEYYAAIQPCDQPCQDAISCDPIEFTFESSPAKIKLGQPYYLWYRAQIKNRSCREATILDVKGFLDSQELRKIGSDLWVTVTGPDGQEIERLPVPRPDGGIAWDYAGATGVDISTEGTIHPYQPNFGLIKQLRDSGKLKGYVSLNPGETFETIAPVLKPYRIVATSVQTEDGGIADGYRWVPVENPPMFPTPPEGFNILDRYKLTRPGRYSITAGFRGKVVIYPIFARWENHSPWLDWFFWGSHPPLVDSQHREVNLVAPPITIEVSR